MFCTIGLLPAEFDEPLPGEVGIDEPVVGDVVDRRAADRGILEAAARLIGRKARARAQRLGGVDAEISLHVALIREGHAWPREHHQALGADDGHIGAEIADHAVLTADRPAQIGGEDERQERGLGEEPRFGCRVDIAENVEAGRRARALRPVSYPMAMPAR